MTAHCIQFNPVRSAFALPQWRLLLHFFEIPALLRDICTAWGATNWTPRPQRRPLHRGMVILVPLETSSPSEPVGKKGHIDDHHVEDDGLPQRAPEGGVRVAAHVVDRVEGRELSH